MKQHGIAMTTILACAFATGCPETKSAAGPPAHASEEDFVRQATLLVRRHGEIVRSALWHQPPRVAVIVTYEAGDERHAPSCPVVILEERASQVVETAASQELLSCYLIDDVADARNGVEVTFDRGVVNIKQQGAKNNAAFTLGRDPSGAWRIREVHFNYVEYDLDNDRNEVVTARAGYATPSDGPRLSEYSYERIKADLKITK